MKEQDMQSMCFSRGFTLVEILIAVAVIAIFSAIAIPNLLKARSVARMSACINNMRHIDSATDQAAQELGTPLGGTPAAATVNSYIRGGAPSCPTGGVYTYPAVGGTTSCSQHGTIAAPQQGS